MVNRNYLDLVGAIRHITFGLVIGAFTFGLVGMVGIATAHADDIPYEDGGTPKTDADWDDLMRRAQALQDAYCLAFPDKCKDPEPEEKPEPDPWEPVREQIEDVRQDLEKLGCTIYELGECIDDLDESIKDAQDKANEVEDKLRENHYPMGDSTPSAPTNSGDPSSTTPPTGPTNSDPIMSPSNSGAVDPNIKNKAADAAVSPENGTLNAESSVLVQPAIVDVRAAEDAEHAEPSVKIANGENELLGLPEEHEVYGLPPAILDHAEYIRSMFVEYVGIQLEVFPFTRAAFNCMVAPCDEPTDLPSTGKFELTLIESGDKLKFDAVISGDPRVGGYRFDQLSLSGKNVLANIRSVLEKPDAVIAVESIHIENGSVRFQVSVDAVSGYDAIIRYDGSIDHMLTPAEQVDVIVNTMTQVEVTVDEAVTSTEYVWENQTIMTPQSVWRNVWRDWSGNIARNADGSISDSQPMIASTETSGYWNWIADYYTYNSYMYNWMPTETVHDDGDGNIYVSTEWSYQEVPCEYIMYTGSHSEWVTTTQDVMVPDTNYTQQWAEVTENVATDTMVYVPKEVVTMTPVTKTIEVPIETTVATTERKTLYPPTQSNTDEAQPTGGHIYNDPITGEPLATTNVGDLDALVDRFAVEQDKAAQTADAGSATFSGEMAKDLKKDPFEQK